MSELDALRDLAASDSAHVAVRVDGAASLTYRDWEQRSTAWAFGLRAAGARAGERIALVFPPYEWTEFAVAYVAVLKIGAIAVPIGSDLGGIEMQRVIKATDVSTAISTAVSPAVAGAVAGEFQSVRAIMTADLDAASAAPAIATGTSFAAAGGVDDPAAPQEVLATARQLSVPRLVTRSAAGTAASRWPVSGSRALLHAFPIGTVAGQDALLSALAGAPLTVTALRELDTIRIAELVTRREVDTCALHPAAVRALVVYAAASHWRWENLVRLIIAGDVAPNWLIRQVRKTFARTTVAVVVPPCADGGEERAATVTAPVAVSQEGMLWHECLAPGCQNLPGLARRYRGPLDVEALRRALDEVLRRHGALRSRFEIRNGHLIQAVRPHELLVLEVHDIAALSSDERKARVAAEVARAGEEPFDLVGEPLFQPALFRLADDEHVLIVRAHHTVFDDWSVGVFRRELAALYAAFAKGTASPLPEPHLQFADFATRQRERLEGPQGERAMAFWHRELAGAPLVTQLPVADPGLPAGSPQASGGPIALELPAEVRDAVRSLARRERVTVYMTMLAAFGVLTARVTDQDDLLLATVVANRNRAELEGLIGCFTKKVPLRLRLGGDPTFLEVLARTRFALLGALAHQEPAFDTVLHDVLGPAAARHGLVPHAAVMFQGVTPRQDLVLPDVESAGLGTSTRAARAHFASLRGNSAATVPDPPWGAGLQFGTFVIVTLVDEGDELSLVARGAFHGPAMRRLLDEFGTLLPALIAAPERPISTVAPVPLGPKRGASAAGNSVDIRGYCVDLARIDAVLDGIPGTERVAILAEQDGSGDVELVAQVDGDGGAPTLAQLRAWVWARLPGYAWPARRSATSPRAPAGDPDAALVRAACAAALGIREVAPDWRYWQNAAFLDALGRMREAGMAAPRALVARNRTLESLAAAVVARRMRAARSCRGDPRRGLVPGVPGRGRGPRRP